MRTGMRKRGLLVLLVLSSLMMLVATAACAGAEPTPTATPEPTATVAPEPTPTTAPLATPTTPPAAAPTATTAPAAGPPNIPHTLEGRDNCLMCHQIGAPGVGEPGGTGLRPDHEGRTIDMCRGCHSPA